MSIVSKLQKFISDSFSVSVENDIEEILTIELKNLLSNGIIKSFKIDFESQSIMIILSKESKGEDISSTSKYNWLCINLLEVDKISFDTEGNEDILNSSKIENVELDEIKTLLYPELKEGKNNPFYEYYKMSIKMENCVIDLEFMNYTYQTVLSEVNW